MNSSPPVTRVILLTGYWPPTWVGRSDKKGMLYDFRSEVSNFMGSNYNVIAVSPDFPIGPDTYPDGKKGFWLNPDGSVSTDPYWGPGTTMLHKDPLVVDYRETSKDLWGDYHAGGIQGLFKKYRPVAIMSFSWMPDPADVNDPNWLLEIDAINHGKLNWEITADWIDKHNKKHHSVWPRPYAGGTPQDYSPYRNTKGRANLPPDVTLNAGDDRKSNLPTGEIIKAINKHFLGSKIVPFTNTGGAGGFISEYMAYHVAWYRDYSQRPEANLPPTKQCRIAGHTHVANSILFSDAAKAVKLQLEALIDAL